MEGDVAIELSGLRKVYGRGSSAFTAVKSVTLTVSRGQVLGLLGPNGAGKTTIIKMICGLIEPTAGTIKLNGYDVSRQRGSAVRQIGAVLEGSRNVYWPLSAWENLLYFGRLKGLRGAEIKPRAQRLLTEFGLWERRRQPIGSFSRGMQQKVAVASALITDPPVILLDEPTLGLDVEAARTFREWITRLAAAEGKAIVLTTHQLEVAQELSSRIAVIKEGEIITDLPTAELLSRYAEDRFQVSIAGPPSRLPAPLPDGAQVTRDGGVIRVTLRDASPAGLYEFLGVLRVAGASLVSVTRTQPDLEEIFIRLIRQGGIPASVISREAAL
ncbi:MAG TPA: ABC transporter ATP-binding protein [Streptosporangiaceae bacterium]